MHAAGFDTRPGTHPIVPIMLYDPALARMAARLLEESIYVVGFYYPMVPEGQARIRVKISVAHTSGQLERAVQAFVNVAHELGLPLA